MACSAKPVLEESEDESFDLSDLANADDTGSTQDDGSGTAEGGEDGEDGEDAEDLGGIDDGGLDASGDETSSGGSEGSGSGGGTATTSGGESGSDVPGCYLEDVFCYGFEGTMWSGAEREYCSDISATYEAEGAPPMNYLEDGCPAGASSKCVDVRMATDEGGSGIVGSEMTFHFYGAYPESEASRFCDEAGGTFSSR